MMKVAHLTRLVTSLNQKKSHFWPSRPLVTISVTSWIPSFMAEYNNTLKCTTHFHSLGFKENCNVVCWACSSTYTGIYRQGKACFLWSNSAGNHATYHFFDSKKTLQITNCVASGHFPTPISGEGGKVTPIDKESRRSLPLARSSLLSDFISDLQRPPDASLPQFPSLQNCPSSRNSPTITS